MTWDSLVSFLVTLLGGGGLGAWIKHRVDLRREDNQAKLASKEQAYDHLLKFVARLESRIVFLETQHADCQKENSELRTQIGALREKVARLESLLEHQS